MTTKNGSPTTHSGQVRFEFNESLASDCSTMLHLVCPVSFQQIDSNASRLTVFMNAVLMAVFMFTLQPILLYIVSVDYFIRATGNKKYSPMGFLSRQVVQWMGLELKPIDMAQKVFASRLGFLCALLGTVFIHLDWPIASMSIIGFFILLATLDAVFDLCVGCLIYNYLVYPWIGHKVKRHL